MSHILIYNTVTHEPKLLQEVYTALQADQIFFTILARYSSLSTHGRPWLSPLSGTLLVSLPLWSLLYGCNFMVRTLFSKTRMVMCVNWPEKIIISPWARWLGWRVLWLELPDAPQPSSYLWRKLSKRAGKKVEHIVFSLSRAEEWRTVGSAEKSVHLLTPSIYPRAAVRQVDLFQALAERPRHRFVIGAIIDNLDRKLIERLLSALTSGLSVCSTLELMIIGEGENRKELMWLIRKMGLGNHVWLVGQTDNILRHLEYVDVFVMPQEAPSLEEIGQAVFVLSQGIPVIGQVGSGFESIITPAIGGVANMVDSEALAAEFLRFEQLEGLTTKTARLAREQAERFTFEKLVKEIKDVLSPSNF